MDYYVRHIGDWKAATAKLTRVQRDIYSDLLDTYYDKQRPLINDFEMLAEDHGCRSDDERAALTYILKRYFRLDGDVYRNDRADEEIAFFIHKIEAASRAGKASVGARAQRRLNGMGTPVKAKTGKTDSTIATVESGLDNSGEDATRSSKKTVEIQRDVNGRSTEAQRGLNGTSTERQPSRNPVIQHSSPDGEGGGEATSSPTAALQPADPNRSKPQRKCPKTFAVSPGMLAWAREHCPLLGPEDIRRDTAMFQDHTFGNTISDWTGAWRNWLRKEQKFREQRAPAPPVVAAREQERQRVAAGLYGSQGVNSNGTSHKGAIDVESRLVSDPEAEQPPSDTVAR